MRNRQDDRNMHGTGDHGGGYGYPHGGERGQRTMFRDFDRDMDRGRSMLGRDDGRGGVDDRGPHYGKGPKGYKRSDERILEEVCERIARQGEIDASDVEVRVESGVIVLSGTVEARHDKRGLEHLVESCYGVDDVRNEIRVRRPQQAVGSQGVVQGNVQGASQNVPPQSQLPGQNGTNARS